MSIVLGVRKHDQIVIAADTLSCFGESERIASANAMTHKVTWLGDSIFGSTGWAVYDDMLRDYLAGREMPNLLGEGEIFTFFLEFWKVLHEKYTMVNDQAQAKDSPFGDLDSSFMIANSSGLFKISSDMCVTEFHQYYAIGSGAEYALGALHVLYPSGGDAETIARGAVDAAIAFDVQCDGEIDVLRVATTG